MEGQEAGEGSPSVSARQKRLLKWLGLALAAGMLWFTFRGVDPAESLRLIQQVGPLALLIPLPFFLAMLLDSVAWRGQFLHLGRKLQLLPLLGVRLASEGVLLSVSGGGVLSEGIAPVLLQRRAGVPIPETAATLVLRKALLGISQAIYIGLGALIGFAFLQSSSQSLLGVSGLGWVMVAVSVLLFGVTTVLTLLLVKSGLAKALNRRLAALPFDWAKRLSSTLESGMAETDGFMARSLGKSPKDVAQLVFWYFSGWLLEAFETFLILRLLGVDISFGLVWAFEPALSLLRHAMFFIPAGLGVQDLGYVAFLRAFGVSDPVLTGSAFVLLKRLKELVFVAGGLLLLQRLFQIPPQITSEEADTVYPRTLGGKRRVLLICGSINQTTQMLAIGRRLKDAECWYTPFYATGVLGFLQRLGLLEMTIAGNKLARRCLVRLKAEQVNIDYQGRRANYDLVVMPTDQVVQGNLGEAPRVLVQEGMMDPENFMFHVNRFIPIFPRWMVSTSATGLSHAYDRFCVASDGYKAYFIRHGVDPAKIVVTGMPNFDACSDYAKNDFPHRDYFLVCTSDARETFKFDNRKKLIQLAVARARGRQILFKLHPNENFARAKAEIARWAPGALVFTEGSAEEMVANAEAVMCQWSSLAYVAMALDKELYSYFDMEALRQLCPIQNHKSADLIAEVCQGYLAPKEPSEYSQARPALQTKEPEPRAQSAA